MYFMFGLSSGRYPAREQLYASFFHAHFYLFVTPGNQRQARDEVLIRGSLYGVTDAILHTVTPFFPF